MVARVKLLCHRQRCNLKRLDVTRAGRCVRSQGCRSSFEGGDLLPRGDFIYGCMFTIMGASMQYTHGFFFEHPCVCARM